MVYQFDRPEFGDGLVIALKRPGSPFDHGRFRLHGLTSKVDYEVLEVDAGTMSRHSGSSLVLDGLGIDLKDAPCSALIKYRVIK